MPRVSRLIAAAGVAVALLTAAPLRAADPPAYILVDDVDDWTVERFCGTPSVRYFVQGPKLEGGVEGVIVFDSKGNAYAACGTFIQLITKDGQVRILTGAKDIQGNTDGPPWKTTFGHAIDIALASDDLLYVADAANFTIRKIERRDDGQWHTETVAGVPGKKGHRDGPGRQALFTNPLDSLAVDEKGIVYVLDGDWLRRIEKGEVTTLNAGTGHRDGRLRDALIGHGMGRKAMLSYDGKGSLYIADKMNMAIRKVDLKRQNITTIAGCRADTPHERPRDGKALDARFHPGGGPTAAFFNRKFDYVIVRSDDEGGRVRRVAGGWMKTFGPAQGRKTAYIGPWRDAVGGVPCGIDADGNVYITGSRSIRVVRKKEGSK